MGLPAFLQRNEHNRIARQQRSIQREILDKVNNGAPAVLQPEATQPKVTIDIKTPKGHFTVADAVDRVIKVDVPNTYETVTPEGEIVTVTKTTTIELEISLD